MVYYFIVGIEISIVLNIRATVAVVEMFLLSSGYGQSFFIGDKEKGLYFNIGVIEIISFYRYMDGGKS
ncbi:MAG TPA: hypothetical protein DHW61_13755 [Lachnoclostridium phytofermentans]|uniref:Uncharacterized protein n=1 Tax=Lachnoclostridium phytofermentans TaxID=66219 RepID=A0A3D2X8K6_9FIRM|nr:hypothetical protein [Lachnoclostridium phytofermentans]